VHVDILSRHLPDAEGTAAGRVLLATSEGLLALGHSVRVTSWGPGEPRTMPSWCEWRPLPAEPQWRTRGRALVLPRSDVRRLKWQPAGTAVADDPLSAAALPPHGVATLHYATALDLAGLRRPPRPHDVQDLRAERRLRRHRHLVLTYSDRVATWVGGVAVPVAVPIPEAPLPFVEAPVAAMVADWRWPPNQAALLRLLRLWPSVRAEVPAAQLLLAGRGDCGVQDGEAGVRVLGEVSSVDEVLARAAVLAFPCPPTSGPKIKVFEAAARGVPVLTTVAGAEGLAPGSGVVTAGEDSFGSVLAALLGDVGRRQLLAGQVREAVAAVHAPVPAARARLAALWRHEQAQEQHREPR
jgi:hypothetical protein